ncbi:MAG: type II toxin-antitoxin system RelE/ParE family toxin [Candidatus Gastranaerophilaceae bacterium]
MIKSFKCKETEKVFLGEFSKKMPHEIQQAALKKLKVLNRSKSLSDLKSPPSNFLEKLSGDRSGQYSIRINKQYRICFRWIDYDIFNVEIVDYH